VVAEVVHWDIFERLGLLSQEEQHMVLAELEKILMCAVNM
jgi:hypothetical protein